MRLSRALLVGLVMAASALIGTAGVASAGLRPSTVHHTSSKTIVIGSENFPEEILFADMYGDLLKAAGYSVTLKTNLGARSTVEPALVAGKINLLPEYAGSLLAFLNPSAAADEGTLTKLVPALTTALAKQKLVALTPDAAEDANVFAVSQATATKYNLKTISDLKSHASSFVLGGPPECPTNIYCEKGLISTYGLHFKSFKALDEAGPISVAALKNNEVQVVELFSTDDAVSLNKFVELTDNLGLEPADHIIPIIQKSSDSAGVAKALNVLVSTLTTPQLLELNVQMSDDHVSPANAAESWLKTEKLIS